jgi:hypothetical protein
MHREEEDINGNSKNNEMNLTLYFAILITSKFTDPIETQEFGGIARARVDVSAGATNHDPG